MWRFSLARQHWAVKLWWRKWISWKCCDVEIPIWTRTFLRHHSKHTYLSQERGRENFSVRIFFFSLGWGILKYYRQILKIPKIVLSGKVSGFRCHWILFATLLFLAAQSCAYVVRKHTKKLKFTMSVYKLPWLNLFLNEIVCSESFCPCHAQCK